MRLAKVAFASAVFGVSAYPFTAGAAQSTISKVTLYPGGAMIERQIQVPPRSARIEISCLPTSFDIQGLRLIASPDMQLGDFRVDDAQEPQTQANAKCNATVREQRVQALQARLAALNARAEAVDLSAAYLKNISAQTGEPQGRNLLALSRSLEQSGYAVFAQRDQIKQEQEDTRRQLDALRGDHDGPLTTRTVQVALAAPRGGTLTITYDTPRAGWMPAYQATLDSSKGELILERRALVAQATGEDWRGVKLQLSTSTTSRDARAPQPAEWKLQLSDPPSKEASTARAVAPAPPAPPMATKAVDRADVGRPLFEPTQIDGTFLTQFEIPGDIDVPSDAQKVGFTLARTHLPVRLSARVVPRQSTRAWLVATASRPEGVWPDGDIQLRRDGQRVGSMRWADALGGDEIALPFGPDDQISVVKTDRPGASGVVKTSGDDVSKTASVRYTIKNLHRTPIDVEVLEATPISDSAELVATSRFTPEPDELAWQGRNGIVAWKRALSAGQEVGLGAIYTFRYPINRKVYGLP